MRLHFIFNPVAGSGRAIKVFASMEKLLNERNIAFSVRKTEYPGHASLLAKEAIAQGYGCIVAVGGDGTVREVAGAMLNSDIPMSILASGTGNDVARALHIPDEPEALLELLLHHAPEKVDAGLANGTFYLNVAGFGFDVDVLERTESYKKRFTKGMTAYILGLLRALIGMRLIDITVNTGEERIKSKALLFAAANGTHFGGGMHVAPKADLQDGLLDICLISGVTRSKILFVLTKFVKGKHLALPYVQYFRAKEITVESACPMPVQLDGEIIEQTPVTFRILPSALSVVKGI